MTLKLPSQPASQLPTVWCVFDGKEIYLHQGELPRTCPENHSGARYLGHNDAANFYSTELVGPAPDGWEKASLRQAIYAMPNNATPLLARAAQLRRFEQSHRYCGACASPLHSNAHDHGKHCRSCGELYYPRLSPAMMVCITRGREILLARGPQFSPGMYSALAGFVEAGETLEACVVRETFEEVGIHIQNLRYIGSQSWPFPHSLMLAFTAEYAGGDITPQAGEIEAAGWFDIEQLPPIPATHSIANWLIMHTVRQLQIGKDGSNAASPPQFVSSI